MIETNRTVVRAIAKEEIAVFSEALEARLAIAFRVALDTICVTGYNWLSTIQPQWQRYDSNKQYDISAMFQYPMGKDVFEHGMLQSAYYDEFRQGLVNKLDKLSHKYKISRIIDGVRLPQQEYYSKMYNSKIVIAPFGYGEIAPRDIESAMFGNILLKNDMSHINTIPNPYINKETYLSIDWDWNNLEEQIEYALDDYSTKQKTFVEQLRQKYIKDNDTHQRIIHLYNLFKNIEGVENEK